MKLPFAIYILFIFFSNVYGIDTIIPSRIAECYRNNMTAIYNKIDAPLTMQLLIDLIQRVERTKSIDMQRLSSSMLHNAKLDGIQRASNVQETDNVIPVGLTSIHFNKFRILLTYLIPGDQELFPTEYLTKNEFCYLHRMISSSVQAWERGDETRTCPQVRLLPHDGSFPNRLIQGKIKSSCPIERGVTKSNWGDISTGHLISAIAGALENQDVKLMQIVEAAENHDKNLFNLDLQSNSSRRVHLNEDINNLWAATLAGDLGEVIAYQRLFSPKLVIGQGGMWNDSLLPRAYYLPDSMGSYWEMTLAETLAGMDGAIIGNSIREWTRQFGRLKLSQVLDLYYSKRGLQFEETYSYKACQRKENIKRILENVDLAKQTSGMAKLLQYYFLINPLQEWVAMPDENIEVFSVEAAAEFLQSIDALTDPYSGCEKGYDVPTLDLLVVIDGSWTDYEGRRLISALVQAADVSLHGSRMGIIKGDDGKWMTNFTHSVFQIFEDLTKDELLWPTNLSLTESLKTIISFLNNRSREDCTKQFLSPRNTVIVVISPTSTVTSEDAKNSKSLINTIKTINPSYSLLFVTSDLTTHSFAQLPVNKYMNDRIIKTQKSIEAIVDGISEKLTYVPEQIIQLNCDGSLVYEDYITPNITQTYEILYTIFQEVQGDIKVEFSGHEYGNLSVCGSDVQFPEHKLCQWMDDRNATAIFAIKSLCQVEYACSVQFKVSLENSKNKCTDNECRFFNQARLQIKTSWTSSTVILIPNVLTLFLLMFFVFINYKI